MCSRSQGFGIEVGAGEPVRDRDEPPDPRVAIFQRSDQIGRPRTLAERDQAHGTTTIQS
jgi:hypothetical protein